MVTGWLKIGNDYYYLKSSGAMTTGWWQMDNGWFYADTSGKGGDRVEADQ